MSSYRLSALAGVLLLCSVMLRADPVPVAGWNWTDEGGVIHEYNAFHVFGISWEVAAERVEDTWHLATITGIEEQNALVAGLQGIAGEYWVGGLQTSTAASASVDWSWVTGESWNFADWAPGEPNDYYGPGSEQHLAVWSRWGTDQWLWNDEGSVSNVRGFIAERTHAVPEPGKVPLFAACWLVLLCFVRKRKV